METSKEKICRFCGDLNEKNLHIFSEQNKDILKATSLFPILIYENDPLPKHICTMCAAFVEMSTVRIQDALELNKNWLTKLENTEKGINYIKMQEQIKNIKENAKESLKLSMAHLINTDTSLDHLINLEQLVEKPNSNSITNANNTQSIQEEQGKDTNMYSCKTCYMEFNSFYELSQHRSLKHVQVKIFDIMTKKRLPNKYRHSVSYLINNKKLIRCLNCNQRYKNQNELLEHWNGSNCKFFCIFCGMDFKCSPNALNLHVEKVHGADFRSLCSQNNNHRQQARKFSQSLTATTNKQRICSICGKMINLYVLKRHLNAHSKSLTNSELKKTVISQTPKVHESSIQLSSSKTADGTVPIISQVINTKSLDTNLQTETRRISHTSRILINNNIAVNDNQKGCTATVPKIISNAAKNETNLLTNRNVNASQVIKNKSIDTNLQTKTRRISHSNPILINSNVAVNDNQNGCTVAVSKTINYAGENEEGNLLTNINVNALDVPSLAKTGLIIKPIKDFPKSPPVAMFSVATTSTKKTGTIRIRPLKDLLPSPNKHINS